MRTPAPTPASRRSKKTKLLILPMALVALVLAMTVTTAFADETWMGVLWNDLGPLAIDSDGNLVVTNDGSGLPAAHYNTPDAFRNSAVQAITFSFIDEGPGTVGAGLYTEDEDAQALTTFGVVPGQSEYQIVLFFGGAGTTIPTGVTRTAGEHTFQLAKLADDSLVYVLDGLVVYTTPGFGMQKFGDVYLRARGGATGDSVTYTYYAAETFFNMPVLDNFNIAFFFGDCESQQPSAPTVATQIGGDCKGIGVFWGFLDAGSLAFLIRNEAAESLGSTVAVVHVYAFRLGGYFAEPIKIAGGSCDAPTPPFDPSDVTADPITTLAGGPWVAWFSVENCDSPPVICTSGQQVPLDVGRDESAQAC